LHGWKMCGEDITITAIAMGKNGKISDKN